MWHSVRWCRRHVAMAAAGDWPRHAWSRLYVVADRVRSAASCDTARMGAAAVVPPAGRPRGRSL